MINSIIQWSITNRILVVLCALIVTATGLYSLKQTPVDAIPDLSDVQVIIKTSYPGQSPKVVEEQVTYPLTTAMLAVPKAKSVRGFSFLGDSYIYIIFEEGTDIYWARSRVLEYLNQVSTQLPKNATSSLGPDATGVGWVYIYGLQDKTNQHSLAELTHLQDWYLKTELQALSGVSEIATVGGMVKQYQVQVDPHKLRAYNIPLKHIEMAIQSANQSVSGSVLEMAEAEYIITSDGYIKNTQQLANIPLGASFNGIPLRLKNVAHVTLGPQMRRGIAELNGEGETVGGIVVMRAGENAQHVIQRVKNKLSALSSSLPEGIEIVTVYDRSTLIESAIDNLWSKLSEELMIVAAVCLLFLWHIRSAIVAVVSLPLGILVAFSIMHWQGVNANIMSLGGIAIAIGAMTDGAIVMIENFHKHITKTPLTKENRWQIITQSAQEVGPALFFSLLIITVSFLPVFMLEAQEGRLFTPLAYTKTFAMAASAALSITLIPVLMGYFIRGKVVREEKNPLNRLFIWMYRPVLGVALRFPVITILFAILFVLVSLWPITKMSSEFMPTLDEGDLMYMPSSYPGISIGKAREILQQTDKLIKTIPEVDTVFGKIGRAETATDPAPLTMIETFIQFKPKHEWRAGLTREDLQKELDQAINIPSMSNVWVMPIKTRIDMLATGIKTPIGLKIAGDNLDTLEALGKQIEALLTPMHGSSSVYAERTVSGRYLNIALKHMAIARLGITTAEVQHIITSAIGGKNISNTVEGLARYPINVRYLQDYRQSPEALNNLFFIASNKQVVRLGDVTNITIEDGPSMIKSENARLISTVLIDTENISIQDYINNAQALIDNNISLPVGYSLTWAGQYEYMERAKEKLTYVIPLTLAIIVILLYLNFKRLPEVFMILSTLPLALVGGIWLIYFYEYKFSIAVGVGFIALAGVAVEIGVIMLVYLNQATQSLQPKNNALSKNQLIEGIKQGAVLRVRPVIMTVATIVLGLLPVLFSQGTGSEVMTRIAAPMVGGMISALVLTLLVLPCIYLLWKSSFNK